MGTPEFAVLCLEKIVASGHEVLMVFTQPDKFFGRKKILKLPQVKIKAEQLKIPVCQPEKLGEEQINLARQLKPDVVVVVAYGKILPKEFLQVPKFGCVNIHASLLPRHRGASPIQTSLVCGDRITGVSAIFLSEKLDAGDVIGQISTEIGENETAIDLFEKLSVLGAQLICKVLADLENGLVSRVVQNEAKATYAPVLTKESGRIDFKKPAMLVHKLICAMVPWPVAFCFFNGKILKIHRSVCVSNFFDLVPGEILKSEGFIVGCGNASAVKLLEVQLESRKKMDGISFLNGVRVKPNFLV